MAGEKIAKDVCGVYSRLFDHRAVLHSEQKYMVREFETKRSDRETAKMAETSSKVSQLEDIITDSIRLADQLTEVEEQLKDARQRCHLILEKEDVDSNKQRREEMRGTTKKQWEEFLKDMEKKEEKIEKDFMTKSLKLKEKYGVISSTDSP